MRKRILGIVIGLLAYCGLFFAYHGSPGAPPFVAGRTPIPAMAQEAAISAQHTLVPTPTPSCTPTPTPTPTPSPTPTPTPSPTPTPEPITEERLDAGEFDSYFDDAVFIGDSLTKGFANYVSRLRAQKGDVLGKARFMGTVSMSVKNACRDSNKLRITFRYQGKAVSVTGGVRAMGAQKAFILLGLNDIGYRDWQAVEQNFDTLIRVLQDKCPDTEIVLQGVFPVIPRFCRQRGIRIEHWNSFNAILGRVCEANGVELYDFGPLFMDENGYMKTVYSDGDFHLSAAGYEVWLRAMRIYAAQKMYPGARLLLPPTTPPGPTPAPTLSPLQRARERLKLRDELREFWTTGERYED